MKIILAPDKFKNALTALEFCDAVKASILSIIPDAKILKLPLADGGDGTFEVANYYLKGEIVKVVANNPFFQPITASYLYAADSKTACIEMAEASGVKLLKPEQFDCKNATTFGTGQLILDAIDRGATKIILGIGGSATNDCGIGMAMAFGYQFLDKNRDGVKPIGANLSKIKTIDFSKVNPKLKDVEFQIACDVSNPLYGKDGTAYVYAKQKGATPQDIIMLENGLKDFSKLIEFYFGVNPQEVQGAGAAGGMGIASKIFLNGSLEQGIELIKKLADFDAKLSNADWIITGEGKLDNQTLSGKTIKGVVDAAKEKKIKVAALCGGIDLDEATLKEFGIQYVDAVMNYAKDFDDAMVNGCDYVKEMAREFTKKKLI